MIFFNTVMAIIGTMQVFVLPYIMTKGGPARATYFITYYLYDNAFVYLKMGDASALEWVQLLIVLALTALAFWSGKRLVHYPGGRVTRMNVGPAITCFLDKGYTAGGEVFAPGKVVRRKMLNQSRHHALLAHGLAAQAVRERAASRR